MSESYYERRRRELGVGQSSSIMSAEPSFYQRRRMDLGLQPDTRPKKTMSEMTDPGVAIKQFNADHGLTQPPPHQQPTAPEPEPKAISKPVESVVRLPGKAGQKGTIVNPNAKAQEEFKPKAPIKGQMNVPTAHYPQNVQSKEDWLKQEAAARDKQLAGAPNIIKKPLQAFGKFIDRAQASIPGIADFQQGAGRALGVDQQTAPTTGGLIGKLAKGAGNLAGYAVNPAQIEQNLFTGGYQAADAALSTKLGQSVLRGAERGTSRAANLANPMLNRAGVNIGSNLTEALAERAIKGGIANGIQNTAIEMDKGHTSGKDIAGAAASGALFGSAGDVAAHGAGALISKAARKVLDRYRPKTAPAAETAQAASETLALPLGRADVARAAHSGGTSTPDVIIPEYQFGLPLGQKDTAAEFMRAKNGDPVTGLPLGRADQARLRSKLAPGVDPITPEYQFKLKHGDEAHQANMVAAHEDLKTINEELRQLNQKYGAAVNDEYKYLQESMGQGVEQGGVITDPATGEVVDRYGRTSKNPLWYQEWYAVNKRKPNKKELFALAKQHVDEGFSVEGGRAPGWAQENQYHETVDALTRVRDELAHSLNQGESRLRMTDATLTDKVNTFKPVQRKPIGEAPLPKAAPKPVQQPLKFAEEKLAFGPIAKQTPPKAEQPAPPPKAKQAPPKAKKNPPPKAKAAEQAFTAVDGTQNYAGSQIPFRQAAQQNKRTIARNQVVKNMRKNLGVVIDTGRLSTSRKSVLGQYKVKPEVVRSRMAEDLQVISHEIGHHLDKKYDLVNDPQYHGELTNLLHQTGIVNTAAYQPSQLAEEGIAEYVRLRLTHPDQARQLAPRFTKFFDGAIGAKMLKGLEASAKDVDTWITQGEFNQAKGLIDFTSGSNRKAFNWGQFYTKFVDDLNPLKLVEKALKGSLGVGKDSIYKMARISRGVGEQAKLAIKRGIYLGDKKISAGLAQIVKPLEKLGVSEEDFSTYLAVRHAMDLKAMSKAVPFTDAQMTAVMSRLDSPEMQAVQQGVIKYNHALLELMVDAQLLTSKAVSEMKTKYPNYVPFMRYFDDDAIAGFQNSGFGSAKGFANITNPIKKMSEEGSTRTLVNPIESIVKNTMLVMNAAAKNKVGLQLAELSKVEGAGKWVEAVSHLTKNGTVVKGTGGASPTEHVVTVSINGEKQAFKVRDPELYNAMLSLDAESSNALIKFLGGSASLLRAGAVLTPEFIARNAFRDALGALVNSTKYGFNPIDYFKGLGHVLGHTETFEKFLSSGGAMSTMMSLDREGNRRAMEKVFRKSMKDKALNIVTSPKELAKMFTGYTPAKKVIGVLRKGAELSEFSTKVGVYNKVLKKTGSMEEAAYAARDLMDFNRAGSSVRQANRAIAFLNASIQGTDKMVRAFKDNPASFIMRSAATLVVPSVGLYYWNKLMLPPDMQEKYKNIPQWQKDNFFIIGIPHTGEFVRIPKPFEAGMIFSTGTERLLEHFDAHNPDASRNYGLTLLNTFTPPAMITAFTPILEAITNYSFFTGNAIANQGDQRFEKKDQYSLYTSETAKWIGKRLSHTPLKNTNLASPKIIDNTIKGYTAGLGGYTVSGIDAGINLAKGGHSIPLPAKKVTEWPGVKAFFASTAGGGQVRDDFYAAWSRVNAKKASADKNDEVFKDPTYGRMHAGKLMIDRLNKQYKLIQNDKLMSGSDKRMKLDALDKKMNEAAAKSLGR